MTETTSTTIPPLHRHYAESGDFGTRTYYTVDGHDEPHYISRSENGLWVWSDEFGRWSMGYATRGEAVADYLAEHSQTVTTTDPADADLIEALGQSISATGDTYLSDSTGTEVPYILTEADVRNGSGRVIGTEYTVSGETYAFLVEAVRLSREAESDEQ